MAFIASPERKDSSRTHVPTGTLRQRPSEHLVLYAAERSLSGTLWLHHAVRGNVTMVFSRGMLWKVRSDVALPLGDVIREAGIASERVVDEALATAARDRRLLGEVLITRQLLESIGVQRALALQTHRKVATALAFPEETVWCFYSGEDALEGYGGADWPRVHPHGSVWSYASAHAHDDAVREILGRFAGKRLELRPDVAARFGFDEGERARVDALKGGVEVTAALLRDARSPIARLLYVLILSRALVPSREKLSQPPRHSSSGSMPAASQSGTHVAMGRSPSFSLPVPPPSLTANGVSIPPSNRTMVPPGSAPPAAGSAPPPSGRTRIASEPEILRPRTPSELGAWIRELHDKLATMDAYELLGVPRDATSEAIRAAHMRCSRELRSERLPPELATLRLPAARVAQRVTSAYRMLMDRNARRVYDQRLQGDGATKHASSLPPPADRRELAAIVDKKLERGEIESAERLCRRTIEAAPGDAEALALLAWVRSHNEQYAGDAESRSLVGQLDEAVEAAPTSALVHYCRARFHKRKGSQVQAVRDFMRTVELDANHVDAARELRLYRLRRERERGGHR